MLLEHFNQLRSEDENTRLLALTNIVNDCKKTAGSTSDAAIKSFGYVVMRLAKGMQSSNSSTRIEFYTAFVTILKLHGKANLQFLIDSIESALTSQAGDTKMERKFTQIARILSLGALIRAKVPGVGDNVDLSLRILSNLVSAATRKKLYRSMATPFICQLLKFLPPGQLHQDYLSSINSLLVKSEFPKSNVDYLRIILTADHQGLTPELGVIENVQELVDILVAGVHANDKELLDLIFYYIQKKDYFEEFWQLLIEHIGPYNSQLFCACVVSSVKNGCPQSYILTSEVILLLLTTLYKRDLGKEVKAEAQLAFKSLLTWKVDDESLSKKERKKILKRLYRGTPNLLHEYQTLLGVIKSHLLCLTSKELAHLFKILSESITLNENGLRVQLSGLGLINQISQLKSASASLQIEIMKFFFHQGFCKQDDSSEEIPDVPAVTTTTTSTTTTKNDEGETSKKKESIQKQCVAYFLAAVRKSWSTDVITPLHEYIVSIIMETSEEEEEGTPKLQTPLTKQSTLLFSKAQKILEKVSQPMLEQITRVGMLQILTNQPTEAASLESWLGVVKKAMEKDPNLEVMLYILDTVVQEDASFFNYEAVFRRIVMQNQVPEEVVQALADAIDPGAEDDEEEEDDIDFDDDNDDDDESENESMDEGSENELFSKANTMPAMNGGSDSDETIDMDDATEEDLKRMDMALAHVFATKKRVKEQTKQENRTYMRVLTLVDILVGRYKEPPISVALMLLMPLVSSLKNSLSEKVNQGTLNRTLSTLKRLNKFTKFTGMEDVDEEILSTMAQEIRQFMKKKLVPKSVKEVLFRSITNILSCQDKKEGENSKKKEEKSKKVKKGKNNKGKNNQ